MSAPSNDQKRLFLALAISGLILLLWTTMFPSAPAPKPPKEKPVAAEGAADAGVRGPDSPRAENSANAKEARPATATAATALTGVVGRTIAELGVEGRHALKISNLDGQIEGWSLEEAQYRVHGKEGGRDDPLPLIRPLGEEPEKGRFLPPLLELELDGTRAEGAYARVSGDARSAVVVWQDAAHELRVERRYELATEGYGLDVTMKVTNSGTTERPYDLVVKLRGAQQADEAKAKLFTPPIYVYQGICERQDDFERERIKAIADNMKDPDEPTRFEDGVRWAGVDNRYFVTAVVPDEEGIEACEFFTGAEAADVDPSLLNDKIDLVVTRVDLPGGVIPAGGSVERTVRFYAGPKKYDALKSEKTSLAAAVDFGWFSPICILMLVLLRWFQSFVVNWGVATILLTILVKILTLPLTHKQYKSMAAMKKLQPKLKELQAKYKDDKPKLQQEMMKLYKENQVNPLAGCLPVLMMMPVYIALYRTIYSAVELYQADFFGWIHDLSQPDPYLILPILLGVLMIVQMRLNPSTGDAMQQKIMQWVMPVMFTVMMLFLPSGLVVYILANTVLGIGQQWWLMKKVNVGGAVPAAAQGRRA